MHDKCYCSKANKNISLKKCVLFDCGRWKKCMKKTNNDIKEDLKKQNRGNKNSKTT